MPRTSRIVSPPAIRYALQDLQTVENAIIAIASLVANEAARDRAMVVLTAGNDCPRQQILT